MARRQYSDDEPECSIYGLRDRGGSVYFYVGSTKTTPQHRLKQHLSALRYNRNAHFVRKVGLIGADKIVADTLERVSAAVRFDREYEWIQKLLGEGVRLTNIVKAAPSYAAHRDWEEYLDRITTPEFIGRGIADAFVFDGPLPDPQYQRLYFSLRRVIMACARHIMRDFPDEWRKIVFAMAHNHEGA